MNTTDTTKYYQPEPHTEFWVGRAEGIRGTAGPELPFDAISKVDHSKTVLGKTAVKHDDGKADWSLLPFEALEEVVKVMEYGKTKYSAHNWSSGEGFKYSRVFNASMRHLLSFMRGEDKDPETGLSHIAHCACNILFLLHFIKFKDKYNNCDDRQSKLLSKDDRNVR